MRPLDERRRERRLKQRVNTEWNAAPRINDQRAVAKHQANYAAQEIVTKMMRIDAVERLWKNEEDEMKHLKCLVPEVGLEPTRRADPRGILSRPSKTEALGK
jgi:hypothetical protein